VREENDRYHEQFGVGLPAWCRIASRCSSSLDSPPCVCVAAIGVAMRGIGLPASFRMAFRDN
jgi:hypothetical protein